MTRFLAALLLVSTGAAAILPAALGQTTDSLVVKAVGPLAVPDSTATSPLQSFNQISINPLLQIGLFADRTAKRVIVFNAFTNQYLGQTAPVFVGPNANVAKSGPDGAILVGTQIWAGDYPSLVRVFDLRASLSNPPEVATIDTGGALRAGSLDYDPLANTVAVVNNNPGEPFISLISTRTLKIRKRIVFDGTNGTPDAHLGSIGGVAYDYRLNRFVISVGTDVTKGVLAVMNPATGAIEKIFPGLDNCQPSTVAEGPGSNVIAGCDPGFPAPDPVVFAPRTYIMNASTGAIVANITQVGGADFVAYNLRDNRYYTASRDFFTSPTATAPTPVLGVIDAATNRWIENVPTGFNAHSLAVNPVTNQILVPLISPNPLCKGLPGCVEVFTSTPGDQDR